MQIKILGSGQEVGRGAIAIEYKNKVVLLDYGVNFDDNDNPVMPLHIPPNKIEALVLTHVHLDHIGAAPLLYSTVEPRAFATRLTRQLSRLMLEDFLKLSGYYLDFEINEVNKLLASITDIEPGQSINLNDFKLEFYFSGHIPGSVSVKVITPEGSVFYTSDMNTIETKLVGPNDYSNVEADVLVIESTYGNADHPERREVEKRFLDTVNEVISNGGTVLVPVFSVGRGQEIMSVLSEAEIHPVFVDGMVKQATQIMLENSPFLKDPSILEKASESQIFIKGWEDRRKIWKKGGVIVSSSGMLKGGPSRYYLRKIADDRRNALLLVSFQGKGTPGRKILETGAFEDGSQLLKARVEWFDFSSHAGRTGLLGTVKKIRNLKEIILVHGELDAQKNLAELIKSEVGINPRIPATGEVFDLKFR